MKTFPEDRLGTMLRLRAGAVYSAGVSRPSVLDLRGLKCPLPVLRTRKAMRGLAPGAELIVACTDPLAGLDIPHLAATEGHRLVRRWSDGDATHFHLAKGSPSA